MTESEIANAAARAHWNSEAARVWSGPNVPMDAMFKELTAFVLDLAAVQKGERVLDIGCATGTTLVDLARRVGSDGAALGVDIAELSVARAKARLATAGLDWAEAVLGDATTHEFAPGTFDLAFSRFGVMFFEDPRRSFSNIRKGLKPGGRLVLIVFRSPEENVWASGPARALADLIAPEPAADPEAPGQFSWADADRVRRILGGAGFSDVTLTPRDPMIRLAGSGEVEEAVASALRAGPLARGLARASEAQIGRARTRLLQWFAGYDGEAGIALPGAIWIVGARA